MSMNCPTEYYLTNSDSIRMEWKRNTTQKKHANSVAEEMACATAVCMPNANWINSIGSIRIAANKKSIQ